MFDTLTPDERGTLAVMALSAQRHMMRAYDHAGRLAWTGEAWADMSGTLAWIAARADNHYLMATITRED